MKTHWCLFLCSTVFPSPSKSVPFHEQQLEQFVRNQDDQLVLEPGTVPSRVVVLIIRVSIVVMKHHDQKQVGEERFIGLTLPDHSLSLEAVRTGAQGRRNREAGADAEAMEECCLLACSLWLAQPTLL